MDLSPQDTRLNSLSGLVDGIGGAGNPYGAQTIGQPFTLAAANSYTPLTLNRILLSYSYMSQGLVQTVVRQPVDDAFRGGLSIKTDELDEDDLGLLHSSIKRTRKLDPETRKLGRKLNPNAGITSGKSDIQVAMDVLNWARLYGGAGLIVNTDQSFATQLDVEAIRKDSPLEFLAADRWELILSQTDIFSQKNPTPFNYYGLPLHWSRVVKVNGVEAPSYIRLRLQGWGMSEIERCIRAINSFVKFEDLIFELVDEAKIDVFKIMGFNDALLTDEGTANTQRRILLANQLKNYQNALAMDKEDDYEQKQLTWSGLAELWLQLRLNLSSALKIPMNKLFGESATGFGGGQDALENYNSIVEQIRNDAEPVMTVIIDLRCMQLFGFIPEYTLHWKPLKVLDGVQEEEVKDRKQNRALQLFQQRLTTGVETSQILRTEGLLDIETEVSKGLRDAEPTASPETPSESGAKAKPEREKEKPVKE